MLFVALTLQAVLPKKRRCIIGAHTFVRSPVIPLLRPQQQLRRLETRGHRHTDTLAQQHNKGARTELVQTGVGSCW